MENHPIPQDVTGFQFKLIGNMTVKQFAYLATGGVIAALLFQLPVNILIKFPFCAFFGLLGVGLAYVPIGGRPMDSMIGYYFKALIRPTIFIYDQGEDQNILQKSVSVRIPKSPKPPANDLNLFPRDELKDYLKIFDSKPENKLDEKENDFLMSVSDLAANPMPVSPFRDISNQDLQQFELQINPEPPVPQIQETIVDTPVDLPTPAEPKTYPQPIATPPPPITTPLPAPTPPVIAQEPDIPPQPAATPLVTKTMPNPAPKSFNKTIGALSAPTFPNLITGATRDARGNALPNILVEVKDKDGNPVRAFKTNELGRFASATPLPDGTYTVEMEDPKAQNKFENMAIKVAGQIIPPIEAVSVDLREELRRSLFGQSN
jgi:hypothetical protein